MAESTTLSIGGGASAAPAPGIPPTPSLALSAPPTPGVAALLGNSGGNLRSLIAAKEQELHDINEYRIQTVEDLLREKVSCVLPNAAAAVCRATATPFVFSGSQDRDAAEAQRVIEKLKADFQYNVKVCVFIEGFLLLRLSAVDFLRLLSLLAAHRGA
jgi:hypothetical protein